MITIITTIINTIAAVLIAARVLYYQRHIQAVASERNHQYTTVVVICVESAALIVLFSILYIVLNLTGSLVSFIFVQCLVHINVRVYNLLPGCRNSYFIIFVYKKLGHIAASVCLSGGSRKGCNELTKTT